MEYAGLQEQKMRMFWAGVPATAGHRGYTTEKELGNVEILPAGEKVNTMQSWNP